MLDMFPGIQMDRNADEDMHTSHCCMVAIGRLQVSIIIFFFNKFY
jgi:aryl hydrocarbon receptor nuclear translocator